MGVESNKFNSLINVMAKRESVSNLSV